MAVTGKRGVGIPCILLHDVEGTIVTVELKNGEVFRGYLDESEDNMNLIIKDVTKTDNSGNISNCELVYLRGSQIAFIILPEMFKKAPMFRRVHMWKKYKGSIPADEAIGSGQGAGAAPRGQAAAIIRKGAKAFSLVPQTPTHMPAPLGTCLSQTASLTLHWPQSHQLRRDVTRAAEAAAAARASAGRAAEVRLQASTKAPPWAERASAAPWVARRRDTAVKWAVRRREWADTAAVHRKWVAAWVTADRRSRATAAPWAARGTDRCRERARQWPWRQRQRRRVAVAAAL